MYSTGSDGLPAVNLSCIYTQTVLHTKYIYTGFSGFSVQCVTLYVLTVMWFPQIIAYKYIMSIVINQNRTYEV